MSSTSRSPEQQLPLTSRAATVSGGVPLGERPVDRQPARVTPPVQWWAALGTVTVVVVAYVVIRWITGPYFKRVPAGPTHVPGWMHVELLIWQSISIPLALLLLYRFVIRPWRRDRSVGPDGILLIGFSFMWFQDPLPSAGNHWLVYNASMLNMGSWANSTPLFAAFGRGGAMTTEPLLFTPAAYLYLMLLGAALGTWVMRAARRRWPQISTGGLVACCFVSMCAVDAVLEALIFLPLGVFEYPGGHGALFPGTYHKYPVNEMFAIAMVFTALSSLRYFTDDRGRMWIERGAERVSGSSRVQLAVRALASIGAMQLIMFLGYTVPNTAIGFNSTAWPVDLQKRSYFTNGICGAGTNRLCPGPAVPNMRNGAAYIGADGRIVLPRGVRLPHNVPFAK
jgi:hypothetical protein